MTFDVTHVFLLINALGMFAVAFAVLKAVNTARETKRQVAQVAQKIAPIGRALKRSPAPQNAVGTASGVAGPEGSRRKRLRLPRPETVVIIYKGVKAVLKRRKECKEQKL